jgi:hypothetical protein
MPDHQPHPAAAAGARARLLDRRVAGGYEREQSDRLLTHHIRTLGPSALAYALHYDGFSTLRRCDADAAALLADEAVQ